ncbi:MAG: hypothetical protein U0984_14405, partial [Prosthecobacter sp.]|nr:hypothetical protein [Prosthecobacter sp.]
MDVASGIKANPSRTLIAFAGYWGSKLGGINSFNSDFLSALGVAFYRDIRVTCVVLDADAKDVAKAAKNHVEVLTLQRGERREFDQTLLPFAIDILEKAGCPLGADTIWLGHDRITGAIAVKAA